jgi:hypothetical protein
MMCGEGHIRDCIQLPTARVALDCCIELCGLNGLEPRTKPRKLAEAHAARQAWQPRRRTGSVSIGDAQQGRA